MNETRSIQERIVLGLNYTSVLIVALGVPGNLLMFILFGQRTLRKLTISPYFRLMAISNIYTVLNWTRLFMEVMFDFYLLDVSEVVCRIGMFLISIAGPISSWCLVAAGIDRFLTIVYPNKFSFLKKPQFSLIISVIIFIYNFGFYSHVLFLNHVSPYYGPSSATQSPEDTI